LSNENKLDEILVWLRFMNLPQAYKVLEWALDTEDKITAYYMSDGKTTSRAIADVITPHQTTIADWWRDWYRLGIAKAISVQRGKRAKKLFDLEDFGIKIPDIAFQCKPKSVPEENDKEEK